MYIKSDGVAKSWFCFGQRRGGGNDHVYAGAVDKCVRAVDQTVDFTVFLFQHMVKKRAHKLEQGETAPCALKFTPLTRIDAILT